MVAARPGQDAGLRSAGDLGRLRDRGVRLEDVVRPRVDREIADLVLADLEGVDRVDRARELGEGPRGVRRAVDVDVLLDVVVRDADLLRSVGRDPLPVVGAADDRADRVEPPGLPAVRGGGDVDVGECQARDVDVVASGRVLLRRHGEVGVAAAGREFRVVRLRDPVWRGERRVVAAAVERAPRLSAVAEAVLGGGEGSAAGFLHFAEPGHTTSGDWASV